MNKEIVELPDKNFFSAKELVELGFYKNIKSLYLAIYEKRAPAHLKNGKRGYLKFPRKCLLDWLEQNLRR